MLAGSEYRIERGREREGEGRGEGDRDKVRKSPS